MTGFSAMLVAALAALVISTACWSTPMATETKSTAQIPPESVPRTRTSTPPLTEDPPAPGPLPGVEPAPRGPRVEPLHRPPATVQRVLPGGVIAVTRPRPQPAGWSAASALFRLAVPVGTRTGAPALADLTAHAVAETPDTAAGKPSLRQRIEALGGQLTVRVGAQSTCFDVQVPLDRWRTALDAAVLGVKLTPTGADQLERVVRVLVERRRQQLTGQSAEELSIRLLHEGRGDAAGWIHALEDHSPEDVELLHRLSYRPAGAVLALCVPGEATEDVLAAAEAAVMPWVDDTQAVPTVSPPPLTEPHAGIHWAISDRLPHAVTLVWAVPGLGEPEGLETQVALEALTMDGVGGRLGQATQTRSSPGVALRCRDISDGAQRLRLLATAGSETVARAAADADRFARTSLTRNPLTADELQTAASRLRLRLLAEDDDPQRWLETATCEALRGRSPVDLGNVLARLENPANLDLQAAARTLAARPQSLVVTGPDAGTGQEPGVEVLDSAFLSPTDVAVANNVQQQIEAAQPRLSAAIQALGGEERLRSVAGFVQTSTRRTPEGVALEETLWYRAPDQLRRVQRVLATTIDTVVKGDSITERCGTKTETLDQADAQNLLERVARHPVILLAGAARGELVFRLVSLRELAGREVAIVQLVDASRERLRMAIDIESGLVRMVETREWRGGLAGKVHVAETYTDYRQTDGIRSPFHCAMLIDDGAQAVDTLCTEVRWVAPEPAELELGALRK